MKYMDMEVYYDYYGYYNETDEPDNYGWLPFTAHPSDWAAGDYSGEWLLDGYEYCYETFEEDYYNYLYYHNHYTTWGSTSGQPLAVPTDNSIILAACPFATDWCSANNILNYSLKDETSTEEIVFDNLT